MDLYQTLNIYDLNIGDLIRNYLKTHHLTQHQFAEDIGLSKSKVDRLFQSRTIDTSLLVVISKALKYNFFALYAGDSRNDNNCETIENIHIGKLIELKLKESNLSQAQLAERLKMNQPVVSKLIKKESVDTGRLVELCHVFDYNFFQDYYYRPNRLIDEERKKYIALLEKYNALLNENARLKAEIYDLKTEIEKLSLRGQ
jgi:transcriptional regulator with XRE-family HTH domain